MSIRQQERGAGLLYWRTSTSADVWIILQLKLYGILKADTRSNQEGTEQRANQPHTFNSNGVVIAEIRNVVALSV